MLNKTNAAFPAAIAISNAVSTMDRSISTSSKFRLSCWSQVKRYFAEWGLRASSRSELMNLSDRLLRDIGVSRYEAVPEASKLFCMV